MMQLKIVENLRRYNKKIRAFFIPLLDNWFISRIINLLVLSPFILLGILSDQCSKKKSEEKVIHRFKYGFLGKIVRIDSITDKSGTGAAIHDLRFDDYYAIDIGVDMWHGWRLGDSVYVPPKSRFAKIIERNPDTTYWIELYPESNWIELYRKSYGKEPYRDKYTNDILYFIPDSYAKKVR